MAILCQKDITEKDVQLYAKTLTGTEYQKELNVGMFKKLEEFREVMEQQILSGKKSLDLSLPADFFEAGIRAFAGKSYYPGLPHRQLQRLRPTENKRGV